MTGGLAGAVLTYLLNQRATRRKQPRLLLAVQRVDYSISSKDEQLENLRVSYGGQTFDNLLLFQMEVNNVSDRTVQGTPFLLLLSEKSAVIDRSALVEPLNRDTTWTPQAGHEGAYVWDSGGRPPRPEGRGLHCRVPLAH